MDAFLVGVVLAGQLAILCVLGYFGLKVRRNFRRLQERYERLHKTYEKVIAQVSEEAQQVQNAVGLAQLGLHFPVFVGGWSIDAFLAKRLVELLVQDEPQTIVEQGSGTSTILIAQCMKLLSVRDYVHIAIDHDARYLKLTRKLACLNGLEDSIMFCECPLKERRGFDQPWYSGVEELLRGRKIDLLLVDGPPGFLQNRARYPALSVLSPFLSDDCTVIIDDAVRADERSLARQWVHDMPGFTLEFLGGGHNAALLTRKMPFEARGSQ